MNSRSTLLSLAVATSLAGCDRGPSEIHLEPLIDGEWVIADARAGGTFLRKTPDLQPRDARRPPIPMVELALLQDTITPLPADTFSLEAGSTRLAFIRVRDSAFFAASTGQPTLYRSPADSQLFAFEYDDAIWVLKAPGTLHKMTLDYDRDALRARQREGAVILYWAANPVWSGDGKFIAFNSNRESVRSGRSGQSLWVIDAYTGVQGAAYDASGESVHTEGAFGDNFVFISDTRPGVWAVHPRTRTVHALGAGYVAARHPRGLALLLNDNGHLTLLGESISRKLPGPLPEHVWSTQAAISPDGDRVAIYSTNEAGAYTLHVLGGSTIAPVALPALPAHGPAWSDDRTIIFSVQDQGRLRTYRATLR